MAGGFGWDDEGMLYFTLPRLAASISSGAFKGLPERLAIELVQLLRRLGPEEVGACSWHELGLAAQLELLRQLERMTQCVEEPEEPVDPAPSLPSPSAETRPEPPPAAPKRASRGKPSPASWLGASEPGRGPSPAQVLPDSRWPRQLGKPRQLNRLDGSGRPWVPRLEPKKELTRVKGWEGGWRISWLRAELGLTQRELGALAGKRGTGACNELECGRYSPLREPGAPGHGVSPWNDRALAFALALGVEPEELWPELDPGPETILWPVVGAWTARAANSGEYLETLLEVQARKRALEGEENERRRLAVELRYGEEELTLEETAAILGVTRERARQIEASGLLLMRRWGEPLEERLPSLPEALARREKRLQRPGLVRVVPPTVPAEESPRESPRPARRPARKIARRTTKKLFSEPLRKPSPWVDEEKERRAKVRKAALSDRPVNTEPGHDLQEGLDKLDKLWWALRQRVLNSELSLLRGREEGRLLRATYLAALALGEHALDHRDQADALLIFPWSDDYRPFPLGADAWLVVDFLRTLAAELGFESKVVKPFHIAFYWRGEKP